MDTKQQSTPTTQPAWMGVKVGFLEGSDWDTVSMVMQAALRGPHKHGWTIRVTLKNGEQFDGELDDPQILNEGEDPCEDVCASFNLIDDNGERIGTQRIVRWQDIAEVAVY